MLLEPDAIQLSHHVIRTRLISRPIALTLDISATGYIGRQVGMDATKADASPSQSDCDRSLEHDGSSGPELISASGHVQEVDRNFGILSLAGPGLTVGNVWPAVGGSILVALFNGRPPRYGPKEALSDRANDHYNEFKVESSCNTRCSSS